MKKGMILLILAASNLFKVIGLRSCRFHPSCSTYSIQAFQQFNFIKAFFLMTKRLLRCHPFSSGGYDPINHPTTCFFGLRSNPSAGRGRNKWWGHRMANSR